jgi:enoyl-CoA hydratase/carnithine racemase
MEYQFIKAEVRDRIALVEMDRKRELNALSFGLMREIHHVFSSVLHESSDVRVIVFTGGDECFSAGIDLKGHLTSPQRMPRSISGRP